MNKEATTVRLQGVTGKVALQPSKTGAWNNMLFKLAQWMHFQRILSVGVMIIMQKVEELW